MHQHGWSHCMVQCLQGNVISFLIQDIKIYESFFPICSGVACGIYTTNSAEVCEHILKDSGSRIIVVENEVLLEKILKCRNNCQIDKIIMYGDEIKNSHNGLVISVSTFLELRLKCA